MTTAMQKLTDQVKANTDLEQSAMVAFNGIADQIAALDDPQAGVLAEQLRTSAASLAGAIPAGTPAA